jgi:hypothetical protein
LSGYIVLLVFKTAYELLESTEFQPVSQL